MKKREDLFHLVQAMSKSEKRYFTLDAKKSSTKGSKYLALFQEINDMELYDEAKLKKKFGKNLRYDKSYLYEAIMRSMRDYRSANSYAAKIKEMILDAQYLYERSLYQQCAERLGEAKGLAKELDDQLSLLEINKSERMLLRQMKGKKYSDFMEKLRKDAQLIIGSIQEESRYLELLDLLVVEVDNKFSLKKDSEIIEFKARYPESTFHFSSALTSERAKLRAYQSKAHYYQLLGNPDGLLAQYSKIVDWWDDNLKIKEEEFHKYVIDISSLLHGYYTKESYHEFPALIEKLEKETPKNHHDQGVVFQKTTIYKLLFYINTGYSHGIDEVVEGVKIGLNKYHIKPASRNALIFNTSVMLFMLERFQQCVSWNTMIIKGEKFITRRDIRNGVMILNLVSIFELDEPDQMETFLRSIYRYFAKQKLDIKESFELKVLSIFKEINSAPYGEINKIFRRFKYYLIALKDNEEQRIPLGLDELILLWINSKTGPKSIIEQIQEKNPKART